MSSAALKLVAARPPERPADRLVLLAIAWHAGAHPVPDEDGQLAYEAWPSVDTLAAWSGLRKAQTVRDAVRRLEASGALEWRLRGSPPRHRTNLYRLLLTLPRDGNYRAAEGSASNPPARRTGTLPRDVNRSVMNNLDRSSSDLDTRARTNGAAEEGDPMADLSDEARTRVRAALVVLAERALANDPELKRLEARSAQLVYLRRLTELAAKHDHLTPEQLASWVDYARATDDG